MLTKIIVPVMCLFLLIECNNTINNKSDALFRNRVLQESLEQYVNLINDANNDHSTSPIITVEIIYNDFNNDTILSFDMSYAPLGENIIIDDYCDNDEDILQPAVFDKGYITIHGRKCWLRYVGHDCFNDIVNEEILMRDSDYYTLFKDNVSGNRYTRHHMEYLFLGVDSVIVIKNHEDYEMVNHNR